MPILPSARQNTRGPRRANRSRDDAERSLVHAFATFTQAADSLEKSYGQLQTEVARLSGELERANSELTSSLDENNRVRGFLAQILEGLPCGVLVVDAGRRLRVINPEARRLLMLDPSWSPEEGVALPAVIDRLLAESSSKSTASEREWSFDDPAGTRFLGIAQAQVLGKNGADEEAIWILRDMTQEKRIFAEQEKSRRNQALAEIATVLAHEIRNPLGSLELFAGLLADTTAIASESGQWVGQIQAGLRTVAATVNNVLQFHSQPCPEPIPTHLDRLLRETVDFLGPLARQRGMQVRLVNRAGKILLHADPHRLQQVFLNLSLNAFRAMSPGSWLTVNVARALPSEGARVQIDFEDQGSGISENLLEKIFEPGFTTHTGSSGLGLAVCKKVIEQHGGTIRVRSAPRLGTTVSLGLPLTGEMA
ncbi:MAG TPA: ATP-binding protein [Candidatus Acidoferrum sp.]|jgi:two-component system sensor histidine kinase FlrB|nr:ATP-binding protein [Candidatus Acidoferrum sp.]